MSCLGEISTLIDEIHGLQNFYYRIKERKNKIPENTILWENRKKILKFTFSDMYECHLRLTFTWYKSCTTCRLEISVRRDSNYLNEQYWVCEIKIQSIEKNVSSKTKLCSLQGLIFFLFYRFENPFPELKYTH